MEFQGRSSQFDLVGLRRHGLALEGKHQDRHSQFSAVLSSVLDYCTGDLNSQDHDDLTRIEERLLHSSRIGDDVDVSALTCMPWIPKWQNTLVYIWVLCHAGDLIIYQTTSIASTSDDFNTSKRRQFRQWPGKWLDQLLGPKQGQASPECAKVRFLGFFVVLCSGFEWHFHRMKFHEKAIDARLLANFMTKHAPMDAGPITDIYSWWFNLSNHDKANVVWPWKKKKKKISRPNYINKGCCP